MHLLTTEKVHFRWLSSLLMNPLNHRKLFLSPQNSQNDGANLGDNIWLLLGDGILPVRFQEQVVPVAFSIGHGVIMT